MDVLVSFRVKINGFNKNFKSREKRDLTFLDICPNLRTGSLGQFLGQIPWMGSLVRVLGVINDG